MMYVVLMKKFFLADSSELLAVRLILASWAKTFDSYILDMIYAEFMKNFHLVCWNKLISVWLISAFSAQKRLIPTF